MLTRKDKELTVKRVTDALKRAKSVVFTDYKGLTANEVRDLRKKLQNEQASYEIIKKSLVQLALNNSEIKGDVKSRKGPLALSISEQDEIAPARIIASFAKEKENLEIVGGVLENKYLSDKEMLALAKLPGKEGLIAQVVGSLKAPSSNLVGVLKGSLRQFIYILKAIEKKSA
jgi:large subunit ribosomal protein L10